MDNKIKTEKHLHYSINNDSHFKDILEFGKALGSEDRLRILKNLQNEPKYLMEISNELQIPLSSVSRHIDILAQAKLIFISYEPGPKGHLKLCSKAILSSDISFEDLPTQKGMVEDFVVEMPIGLYSNCNVTAPCGIIGADKPLGAFDDSSVFFSTERANAELLWFNLGEINYKFPLGSLSLKDYKEIDFSFEVCSETIYHCNKWPSDITVLINDVEVVTFTSPGDFGGRKGNFTPSYWPINSTQYGILMNISVNEKGVYVNNSLKNKSISFSELHLEKNNYIKFALKIKENAVHKGGINLFGKNFGDYPQGIIMTLRNKVVT
ncbi:MAG: helix-turn-helix domain-containing protein [Acholeplasmataceae bacterium]